jgi:DNA-binding CsgD family transcriptional regulator
VATAGLTIASMLIGRDRERRAIDGVVETARDGTSAVLALVGEPGIGKTSLLDYAAGGAGDLRLLRARGVEAEAQVPFAGLLELVRPALGRLDQIPKPQASALAAALALRPGGASDPFAVGAATLSLLAAFADDAPLLALVDDAHWLDEASAAAILFAVRRLVADPIAFILAVREGEPSLFHAPNLPTLEVGGLGREASAELLTRQSVAPLSRERADRLFVATAGNPLALIELASEGSRLPEGPAEIPVPVSRRIADAFLRRGGALPDLTRQVLVLAAASDDGDLTVLARAASKLGLDVADLTPAADTGLISVTGGHVEFRHPLARSAVYSDAPAEDLRAAHRALAEALPDRDIDRRAWHLSASAFGPNDTASAALELAGERAHARSAFAVASKAFEQAARLATADERRGRLFHAAASSAWLAGLAETTVALLDDAAALTADPDLILDIEHLRGHAVMRLGPVMDGHAILVKAAEHAVDRDLDRAVVILAEAVNAAFYAGDALTMARTSERMAAIQPSEPGGEPAFFAAIARGMALVITGEGEPGVGLIRKAVSILEASPTMQTDPRLLAWAAMGPLWLREVQSGRALIDRALGAARSAAALGVLPFLLTHVAVDQATTDQWAAAAAAYDEAGRLARETGQHTDLAFALAGLARLEARQGLEESCRTHATEARELCRELGVRLCELWSVAALGDLELGLGRAAPAVEWFLEQQAMLDALGIGDVDLSPAPELVEAYLRLGQADEAAEQADVFATRARAKGQPWALARAARCRGMLSANGDLDEFFSAAIDLHEDTPDRFEGARTRFAYGARLRRAKQRTRARAELRAALEVFDDLGATSWAKQAETELAATGETVRRRDPRGRDTLTPQEVQIALLLAGGHTTREAAAALFLSPKTIEYHLSHVYRKLGIHSRAELAAELGSGGSAMSA